jgi:hypothetical protein
MHEVLKANRDKDNYDPYSVEVRVPTGMLGFKDEMSRDVFEKEAVFQNSHHITSTTLGFMYSVKVRPAPIPHDAIAARKLKAYIKRKEQEEKDKEYKRKRDKKEGTAAQRLSFFGMYVTQKENVAEEDIKSEPEDHELMVEVTIDAEYKKMFADAKIEPPGLQGIGCNVQDFIGWIDGVNNTFQMRASIWQSFNVELIPRSWTQENFFREGGGLRCDKGHRTRLLTFDYLGWYMGPYMCLYCQEEETDLGAHVCDYRCQVKPVCEKCHVGRFKVQQMEDSVEAASPLRLAQLVVPGQIPFPHLRDEEEIVALRLLFSYNVDRALYNADPWSQECGLAEGMVDAVRLGTMQVGLLQFSEAGMMEAQMVIFSKRFLYESPFEDQIHLIPPVRRPARPGDPEPRGDLEQVYKDLYTVVNSGKMKHAVSQGITLLDVITLPKGFDHNTFAMRNLKRAIKEIPDRYVFCDMCKQPVVDYLPGQFSEPCQSEI